MDNCMACGNPNRDAYRCEVCGQNPYRTSEEQHSREAAHQADSGASNGWGFWKNFWFVVTAVPAVYLWVIGQAVGAFIALLWPNGKLAQQQREAEERHAERERNMSDHGLLVRIARSTGSPSKR